MTTSFIQPETIAILKLIYLAKQELTQNDHFGAKNKPKKTPIIDFVIEEIESDFVLGENGRSRLRRMLSLNQFCQYVSQKLSETIAKKVRDSLYSLGNLDSLYKFILGALNELEKIRQRRGKNCEYMFNSVIHLFIRRCTLELRQLRFDDQIKLFERFKDYLDDEIGIITPQSLNEKIQPGYINKVASAAKKVLEKRVPLTDIDFNGVSNSEIKEFSTSPLGDFENFLHSLDTHLKGNLHDFSYNFHNFFNSNMKKFFQRIKGNYFRTQTFYQTALYKILLQLKGGKLEEALKTIHETIRQAQANNDNNVISYCQLYKTKVFELLGMPIHHYTSINDCLKKSIVHKNPEIMLYACLQYLWVHFNYDIKTLSSNCAMRPRFNITIVLNDAISKIMSKRNPNKELISLALAKRSECASMLGARKLSKILTSAYKALNVSVMPDWDQALPDLIRVEKLIDESIEDLLNFWSEIEFSSHSSAIRLFYDSYLNAKILLRRNSFDLVKLSIIRMEKILEEYPMPSLHIKLLYIQADHLFLLKRPQKAMNLLSNLLSHLEKRGLNNKEYIECYYRYCSILFKVNTSLKSFIAIREGITKAEKGGFRLYVSKFKFLLAHLYIDNKNVDEATNILQSLGKEILSLPSKEKMRFYYLKTILSMSLLKDKVITVDPLILDNVLINSIEALKQALRIEDFTMIKKLLYICANIYAMKYEVKMRDRCAIQLKKFKLMEISWSKLANKVFLFEDIKSCLKLNFQIHTLMKHISAQMLQDVKN